MSEGRTSIVMRNAATGVAIPSRPTAIGAARQAVDLALAGLAVELEIDGETRLYSPETVTRRIPYKLRCPKCESFTRFPRGRRDASVCRTCYETPPPPSADR